MIEAMRCSLLLLLVGACLFSQEHYNWTDEVPPPRLFSAAFDRLWSLSLDKEPFSAIRGEVEPNPQGWFATLNVAGADPR
jgi:hypothetical protein